MQEKWLVLINDGRDTILDVRSENEKGSLVFEGETLISKQPFDGNRIIVPEGVTKIGGCAFSSDDCVGIKSITISSSVSSLDWDDFSGCLGLESITVAPNNKVYDSRNDCNAIIETATGILIKGCRNTEIPDGVKEIGLCAFCGCDLTEISLPNSLVGIGVSAFSGTALTDVYIPYTVKWIADEAFAFCPNLHFVEVPDTICLERREDGDGYRQFYKSPCTIKQYPVSKGGR